MYRVELELELELELESQSESENEYDGAKWVLSISALTCPIRSDCEFRFSKWGMLQSPACYFLLEIIR